MYQRILAPLKQNDTDDAVLEHVAYLAALTGARVLLLHVIHSHSRDESIYREEQAQLYLQEKAGRLLQAGLDVAVQVVPGEPAEAIVQVAHHENVDLVVMATHGHSEVRHIIVGSVTEDVVRDGELPVLLVRPPEDRA